MLGCATVCRDAGPHSGMPQKGCGGLYRRVLPDESVRGQSDSRRHSQTSIQDKADKTSHTRFIDFRSDAFGFGVAAGAEIGLSLTSVRIR